MRLFTKKKESVEQQETGVGVDGPLICDVHGVHGIFSEEKFFRGILKVSCYLLVLRLAYTFAIAAYLGESWNIRFAYGWLPIMGFNSPPEVFADLNSYALLAMASTEFIIFLRILFQRRHHIHYQFWAWYAGIMMTVVQYASLLYLSSKLQFGINDNLWLPLGGFAVISTALVYLFKRRVYLHAEEFTLAKDESSK